MTSKYWRLITGPKSMPPVVQPYVWRRLWQRHGATTWMTLLCMDDGGCLVGGLIQRLVFRWFGPVRSLGSTPCFLEVQVSAWNLCIGHKAVTPLPAGRYGP